MKLLWLMERATLGMIIAQALDDVCAGLTKLKIPHFVQGNNDSGHIRIIIGKGKKKTTLYFGEGEDLP